MSSAQLVECVAAGVAVNPVSVSPGSRGTSTQPSGLVPVVEPEAWMSQCDSATALAAEASMFDCSGTVEGDVAGSGSL